MAYDRKELIEASLTAISKHKLFFIQDIPPMIGVSIQTFYNHELEKLDAIKDALRENRVRVKSSMRKKWYDSENATLQMALYKLIADDDEVKRLSMSYNKNENENKDYAEIKLSDEQFNRLMDGKI